MTNHNRLSRKGKILSVTLAGGTAVGVVGLIANQVVESATVAAAPTSQQVMATTADGLTAQDLIGWQAQLNDQQKKLDSYKAQLVALRTKLNTTKAQVSVPAVVPAVQSAPRATKPKATVAKPQSTTKGSAPRKGGEKEQDD
jgi:hypothetical protein